MPRVPKFLREFVRWLGYIDAFFGRLGVLKWVFYAGAGLFVLLGLVDALLILVGLVLLFLGLLGAWRERARRPGRGRDLRREAEAVLAERKQGAPAFSLNVKCDHRVEPVELTPGSPGGRFFFVRDVVITNSSPRGVSLLPKLAVEMENNSYFHLEQKPDPLLPLGVSPDKVNLLRPPIDIDPTKSCRGDLGFVLPQSEFDFFQPDANFNDRVKRVGGMPVFYLAWLDLVSGGEVAQDVTHPAVAQSRPSHTLDELLEQKHRIRTILAPDPVPDKPRSEMTPYERLQPLHLDGVFIAEASAMATTVDGVIKSINDVAAWSNRVRREVKDVAPDYAADWAKVRDLGHTGRDLTRRLEILEGIMSRLKGRDGG